MLKLRKLQLEELLPILLAMAGVVGITPFVVIRLLTGDYALAAVDAVIVVMECVIIWAIYGRGAIRGGSIAMSILCALGAVAVVHLKGGISVFWLFPLVVAIFFLLKPIESVIGTLLTTIAISPVIFSDFTPLESTVVFASIIVTCIVSAAFSALTAAQRRRLTELTLRDPLTGAENRRAMDEAMQAIIAVAATQQTPFSLIMLDIDYFKRINDEHGHAVGDRVLSAVSDQIRATIRADDRLYRVGGEEFVVISKGAGVELARRLGETLRESVSQLCIPQKNGRGESLSVTVSLGVAELLPDEDPDHWYKRADDALYEAKRSGRNRTLLADKTVSLSGTDRFSVTPRAARAN